MLDDAEDTICELAKKKIETASYQNTQLLVEALATPHRKIRKSIFDLLEALNIKDLDFFRFAQKQIQDGYQFLSDAISLEAFPENDARNLLTEHLQQKISLRLENVLRVLAAQDQSGQIKIICRGLSSADIRKRSNAMEALDSTMEHRLFRLMLPLMEVSSPREALDTGKKYFQLIGLDSGKETFISYLLADDDWVIVALTLELIQNLQYDQIDHHVIQKFTTSQNHYIRQTAEKIIKQPYGSGGQHGG
jgi:hypothetical protein